MHPVSGDVLLVARLRQAGWVSRLIQKYTVSWYSHALVALGDGRFAHAVPGKDEAVRIVASDTELKQLIKWGSVYDLYRPDRPPQTAALLESVAHFQSKDFRAREVRTNPCERISSQPGYIFSDGDLLALLLLRLCQKSSLADESATRRLINAIVAAVEDAQGRLFCSGFVHRVLEAGGSRPVAGPPSSAFVDLSDFITDEPVLRTMGPSALFDRLVEMLQGMTDMNPHSLPTCREVAAAVLCHHGRETPVPEPLHMANFFTPSDLGISPSLTKIASRYRRPNGEVTPWKEGLTFPPPGVRPE